MSCNNCNQRTCNGCHAEVHICNQCPPEQPCDCPIKDLNTDCSIYTNDPIECNDVVVVATNTILSDALKNIVDWTCTRLADIQNFFTIKNVGAGAQIYKGINLIGEKELKSLTKTGDLIVITPSTNEIDFTIDEDELTNFVNTLIPTPVDVCVQSDTLAVTEDEGCFNVELEINSDSLVVTNPSPGVFQIEQPSTTAIPALYVNNNYEPTYQEWLAENTLQNGVPVLGFEFIGKGTLAQPFTDTTVYVLNVPATPPTITPNTAIQNALDGDAIYSYVGSGTVVAPEKAGQRVVVQNNNGFHTFTGNFNYQSLYLKIEGSVLSTTTGFLLDLDVAPFDVVDSVVINIDIDKNVFLQIQGDGFNNSGNTLNDASPYSTTKKVGLLGEGTIFSAVNDITKYIINSDITNTGNNNDFGLTFEIRCILRADKQGIYRVGGVSRIDIYNQLISGSIVDSVDVFLRAYHQTGGQVRAFKDAIFGFNSTPDARRYAITFNPTGGFTPSFTGFGSQFTGNADILFFKENDLNTQLVVVGSNSGVYLQIDDVFDKGGASPWYTTFKNNIFQTGSLQNSDITNNNTVSSTNTIGNEVIETLRQFSSKEAARVAGLESNSAFLLVQNFDADDLVAGVEYQIVTEGTPSLGGEGEYLTATGAETGTGVARLIRRDVLL